MRRISIFDLPQPPEGKTGWPWTECSDQLPMRMSSGDEWPKISVITPSYNYGQYIEETIRSVLLQGYPNLEFIIIDGGSKDATISIANKYRDWIDVFISEVDSGMTDALLKGFRYATGDYLGWQNADDFYGKNFFNCLGKFFNQGIVSDVLHGITYAIDDQRNHLGVISYDDEIGLGGLESFPLIGLANQSLVIRVELIKTHGFVDKDFSYAMDAELMSRMISVGAKLKSVPGMEGYYRIHDKALTFQGEFKSAIESCRICEKYLTNQNNPGIPRDIILAGYYKLIIGLFRGGLINEFKHHAMVYMRNRLSFGILTRYGLASIGVTAISYPFWIRCLFAKIARG